MEIVIDIPEEVLKRTVFYREFKDLNDCVVTIKALENGTPLPEHHGRLIDADALIDSLGASDRDIYCKAVIEENAPTIIEGSDTE